MTTKTGMSVKFPSDIWLGAALFHQILPVVDFTMNDKWADLLFCHEKLRGHYIIAF